MLRSLLFVPGSRPDRFEKALAAGASRVIIDLEDAVAPDAKEASRRAVADWLAPERPVMIRINGADTPWFDADLALSGHPGVIGVVLPKAEDPAVIARVVRSGARMVVPIIETGAGFIGLPAIAGAPSVAALAFGSVDLERDLGMHDPREDELLPFRLQLVIASRFARISPPIDGVTVAIDDEASLRADAQRARRLGFGGKLCIHPRQVPDVNRALAPSADERAWALRVVEAARRAGDGVVTLDGKMIDRPVVLQAEAILDGTG